MRNSEVAGLQDRLANLNRGAGGNGWIDSDFEPAVLSGMLSLVASIFWVHWKDCRDHFQTCAQCIAANVHAL